MSKIKPEFESDRRLRARLRKHSQPIEGSTPFGETKKLRSEQKRMRLEALEKLKTAQQAFIPPPTKQGTLF